MTSGTGLAQINILSVGDIPFPCTPVDC